MQVTAGDAASGENGRLSFVHVWALTTPDALVVLGHHLTSPHLTSPHLTAPTLVSWRHLWWSAISRWIEIAGGEGEICVLFSPHR